MTPLGVASGVPYVVLGLISLWMDRPWHVFIAATAGTALTVLGFFFSPHGGVLWMVLLNRLLTLFVIWIATILGLLLKSTQEALHDSGERTRSVVDNRVDGIITDARGMIESFNPGAGRAP